MKFIYLKKKKKKDRIGWLNDDNLWCTTHNSLQLWDCDGATPYAKFERSNLTVSQVSIQQYNYIIIDIYRKNQFQII